MNERLSGILLQLVLVINLVTAQIQFPNEYFRQQQLQQQLYQQQQQKQQQRARSAQNYATNSPPLSQQTPQNPVTTYQENSYDQRLASTITQGFTNLVLDVNRISQAISPDIANADYVIYGPLTISGALSLVLLASVGQTFNEIANCLGLSSVPDIQNDPIHVQLQIGKLFNKMDTTTGIDVGHHVNFASAIFVQKDFPIRPAYQEIVNTNYKSNVMNLDFLGNPQNAKHVINTWVSGRTNKKIPTLLDEAPSPDTTAIVASVLYFQSEWQYPFFNGHTKFHAFYTNGRKKPSSKMVEMMSNGGDFPYFKDTRLGVEIMGFPYKGNHSTMYVIVPNGSNKEKLKQLENSLTPSDIHNLVNSVRYTEAVILFPKMRLKSTIHLRGTLQSMGVKSLFDPSKANLALLSPGVSQRFNEANEAPFVSQPISASNQKQVQKPATLARPDPPASQQHNLGDRLIFTRYNEDEGSCTPVYDPATNTTKCQVQLAAALNQSQRYKRANRRRAVTQDPIEELESIRQQVNQNPVYANPGLYADEVIHKVYIDITESGTEAAAATSISLNRSGGRVTFRVDVPFLFFIYHEDTGNILFWGSVKTPSPSIAN